MTRPSTRRTFVGCVAALAICIGVATGCAGTTDGGPAIDNRNDAIEAYLACLDERGIMAADECGYEIEERTGSDIDEDGVIGVPEEDE